VIRVTGAVVRHGATRVLGPISLRFAAARFTAILGPSGAGKSTLLRALAGASLSEGEVTIDRRPLAAHTRGELARTRALLAQSASCSAAFSARELVRLGRIAHGDREHPRSIAIADGALRWAGLDPARFAERSIDSLSGGELQRAHLARVRAQLHGPGPRVLLLDEPTAHLDLPLQSAILERCRALCSEGVTVVAVLHELSLAAQFAHESALLREGALLDHGPTERVLSDASLSQAFGAPLSVSVEPRFGRRVVLAASSATGPLAGDCPNTPTRRPS
jgi:iron complex transport system ATP-binding protein